VPNPTSFQFVLPPPPPGFSGTLAQVFALIQSTLQGSLAVNSTLLGSGSVLPTSDLGPFIYTAIDPPELYTWSPSMGKYVPAALPPGTAIVTPTQLYSLFGGLNNAGTQINVNWAQIIGVPSLLGGVSTTGNVGNTAQLNALTPNPYNQFFNTDINALLIYYNGIWHTVDGVPGDVKHVSSSTLAGALLSNPGWSQNTNASSRVLISAGQGIGLSAYINGQTGGAESVTLAQTQLPASLTNLTITAQVVGGGGSGNAGIVTQGTTAAPSPIAGCTIANSGGSQPTPILPPLIAYWCLIKT